MGQAEIFSLLSLPCYRFVGDKCVLGTLECQENQVRFKEFDRIFSLSFYKIENIELRTVDSQLQLVFLTHVGLINFYFYEDTSINRIRYFYDAVLGAFAAYQENTHTTPIWSGSFKLSGWANSFTFVYVFSESIVIQIDDKACFFERDTLRGWTFEHNKLNITFENEQKTIRGSNISLLELFTNAIKDGAIQGLWRSKSFFNLHVQFLVVSNRFLYLFSQSWEGKQRIKIELCHIHTIRQKAKTIEFESLTHPHCSLVISKQNFHYFRDICNTFLEQMNHEHVFLWRRKKLVRGTLTETEKHLVIRTLTKNFQWKWDELCRDDDDSQPNLLSLRTEKECIRIHTPSKKHSSIEFYNRHVLPHRRLRWKDLSSITRSRISTNRIVHIQSDESVFQIVARMERVGSNFRIFPISVCSIEKPEIDVQVHFHTESGQYSFETRLFQIEGQLFILCPDIISLTSQRYAPRYRTNKTAIFSLLSIDSTTNRLSATQKTFTSTLINISEGGACILTSIPISTSQQILLDIDDYPQQIICIVRHCTQQSEVEYKIGLQFSSLSNQIRKNINEMLQIFVKERN